MRTLMLIIGVTLSTLLFGNSVNLFSWYSESPDLVMAFVWGSVLCFNIRGLSNA